MEAIMLSQCNSFRTREQELLNAQIQNRVAIREEEIRLAHLHDVIARNPDAICIDNRQVVSVERGAERFLLPAAQLVASEIQISELKLAEVRRERDRIASALKRDYYCQARQTLQQPTTGRTFLEEIKHIQAAVFQSQGKSIDAVEQTRNEIDVERANGSKTYLQSMRFAPPPPPEGTETRQSKPAD